MINPESVVEDGPRWNLAFTILSLDRTQPFLPAMALDVQSPSRMQSIARRFVTAYSEIDANANVTEAERANLRAELVAGALDEFGGSDSKDRQLLLDWVSRALIYDSDHAASSMVQRRILRLLARGGLEAECSTLSAEERKNVADAASTFVMRCRSLQSQLVAARRASPSPWDHRIDEAYTPGADVADWLEDTSEGVAAESSWGSIMRCLSDADRSKFIARAQLEAQRMGLSLSEIFPPG